MINQNLRKTRRAALTKVIVGVCCLLSAVVASAAEQVLDEVPCYWYTFDGKPENHGLVDLEKVFAAGHDFSKITYYEEVRPGVKGARLGTDIFGASLYKGNGSFTVFISAKGGSNNNYAPVFALGSKGTSGQSLALVQANSVVMGLAKWEGSVSTSIMNGIVPACCNSVHPYAIVYDADSSKLRFYIDGELSVAGDAVTGEKDFSAFADAMYIPIQFGSVYGGLPNEGSSIMKSNNSTAVIEDFRTYNRALSAEEVKKLSDAYPVYSGGVTGAAPYHWWEFKNGVINMSKSYPTTPGFSYGTSVTGPRGETASNGFTGSCWGAGFDYGSGKKPFTIALYARLDCYPRAYGLGGTLFALGSRNSSGNIAISGNTVGGIWLTSWYAGGVVRKIFLGKHPLDRNNDFHSIVVTCDKSVWKLYVDGVQSQSDVSVTDIPMPNDGNWQFGGISGGNLASNVGGDGRYSISDFRFYHVALTAEQVAELAAAQPVWPGADQVWKGGDTWTGTEAGWMTWNASSWSETLSTFNPALSALVDVPVTMDTPLNYQVGDLKLDSTVTVPSTFGGLVCDNFSVGEHGSITVSGVTGRFKPGVHIARVKGSDENIPGIDYDTHDEWGNSFYMRRGLWYGMPVMGVMIVVR